MHETLDTPHLVDRRSAATDPDDSTMRSIVQRRYGLVPEEVLRLADVPRPTPSDGEVLVRVHAASIDRGTWHIMAGLPYPMRAAGFGLRRPKAANPGRSIAGTVVSIGRDVAGFEVGDRVYGTSESAFAEYAQVDPARLAHMPTSLSFEQAAAVPISGLTALQAVRDHGKVQPGERVLILGASGGVGTFAVQIAKELGAEVTGVCSAGKVDLVRSLGADHVLDYALADPTSGAAQYDVILDIGGNRPLSALRRALTPTGRLVIVGGETDGRWLGGTDRQLRATVLSLFVRQQLGTFLSSENAADLDALRALVDSGAVSPAIDRTYPLSEVAAAIRDVSEGRARGKVVVAI